MNVPAGTLQELHWLRAGEARFLDQVDELPDEELRADSALPGWTRAHVIAHVARNAEAVSRLLSWASTGRETPMYPDQETRDRDIETSLQQDPGTLRADVRGTSAQFDAEVEALPDSAWSARVRTFQGREVPATFVVWMRVREVWLHLVDLGVGVSIQSWPVDLVDALLDEVTETMKTRSEATVVRLTATDRNRAWQIGAESSSVESDRQTVSGRAADLLAWLTGRSTGEGLTTEGALPRLPHWM